MTIPDDDKRLLTYAVRLRAAQTIAERDQILFERDQAKVYWQEEDDRQAAWAQRQLEHKVAHANAQNQMAKRDRLLREDPEAYHLMVHQQEQEKADEREGQRLARELILEEARRVTQAMDDKAQAEKAARLSGGQQ